MKILLVTKTDKLAEKLAALNPALDYCAIVTDEVEPAKEVLGRVGLSQDLLRPMDELKACSEGLQYDYIVCVEDLWWGMSLAIPVRQSVSKDKAVFFCSLTHSHNFLLERSLRYFEEHASEFEMIATGISFVEKALDVTQFKRKLFNFGRGSQDLYYNFQVAKRAVVCGGGITA